MAIGILTGGVFLSCSGRDMTSASRELTVIGTEYAFAGPTEVEAGVVTVRLVNEGVTELHNAALMRLTEGHTLEDFSAWMDTTVQSPPWAVHVGGVESIPPGATAEVVVILEPGPHLIVCYHGEGMGRPHHALGMISNLDVVEAAHQSLEPEADVDLIMVDYDYLLSDSLSAGDRMIRVLGGGPQIHNVLIWKLDEGRSAADLAAWLESDRTAERPAIPLGGLTALAPGHRAYLPLQLEAGRYALVCLVPDLSDGRFHMSHGMIREIVVS